jgi:hypothetical protein
MAKRKLLFDVTNIICLKLTRIYFFVSKFRFSALFNFMSTHASSKKNLAKVLFVLNAQKAHNYSFRALLKGEWMDQQEKHRRRRVCDRRSSSWVSWFSLSLSLFSDFLLPISSACLSRNGTTNLWQNCVWTVSSITWRNGRHCVTRSPFPVIFIIYVSVYEIVSYCYY